MKRTRATNRQLGSTRVTVIILLAATLAAGLGLWLGSRIAPGPAGTDSGNAQQLKNALLYPKPRALPAFALDGADGGAFDSSHLQDHWNLVFVGFTHCPDICPTTLATLGELEKALPGIDPALQIVFVSVDPERDSAERATEYARYFSAGSVGVTASHDRLEPFTRSLGMVYMQTPLAGRDYTVDHSSRVAIVDPQGRQVGVFRPPFVVADMADDLRRLAAR